MKITAQSSIINSINKALEETTIGMAINTKYLISVIINNDNSSIEFTLKDGEIQTDADIFWLGWFSNQYFEESDLINSY